MLHRLSVNVRIRFMTAVLMCGFFLLTGFKMTDDIVKEMDAAYRYSDPKNADVSQVVQQYFPAGMWLSKALQFLVEQNFEITEHNQDGFRKWPNGELWLYQDEAHRKSALSGSRLVYSAQKSYDRYLLFFLQKKRAVITIRSDGEKITKSNGFIHVDGI